MKHVEKGEAPNSFVKWLAQSCDDWKPTYADLQKPEKRELHRALLNEQGWVCCYCGCRITQDDSHIEHFRPQETNHEQALNYTNLHASCNGRRKQEEQEEQKVSLHCGHAKANKFDEAQALSPMDTGCEQAFRYTLNGQIIPDNDKAVYMCDLLKLDIAALNNRRKAVLEGVFDNDFVKEANNKELACLCEGYRQLDKEGYLPDFGHVVARYAEQLMVR